mmetsp:Transcript_71430/g.209740  ORF Transcript_71430/g.209740 Transcript_71430/m.209740 type:complete len:542 (+) Transcript_71430:140-1765(+)
MGDDGGGHSGFGQGRGGNDGMSGAPMWQIKKKMAITDEQKEQIIEQLLREKEIKSKPAEPPWVLVDAVSSGESIKGKPLVRHVLVKDLNKVAALKNAELPSTGIFQMKDSARKAPMGLFAVFDGQSCAGEQGPIAAEFCARNFHVKLLANLTMLRPEAATDTYVKAAIIKSFHDLDAEYLVQHSDVHQGCGAAVALLIADYVIVAVLGKCSAVLVESVGGKLKPVPYGLSQAKPSDPSERIRLQKSGAVVVTSGNSATIRHPSGALSPVSRSIGDPLWKGQAAGGLGPEFLIPTPEVASIELKGHDSHPSLFLVASPVAECLSPQDMLEVSSAFSVQPRLACGEIAAKVQEALKAADPQPQHVVAQVCFLPAKEKPKEKEAEKKEPPLKKAKLDQLSSMRLRHILVKHSDPAPGSAAAKAKAAPKPDSGRTRLEAEVLLRQAMHDLQKDLAALAAQGKKPRNPTDLVVIQSKKFADICRTLSECPTAKKGGSMCGDLGWMTSEQLNALGGAFREKVAPLKPGQWSDICPSDQGVHLVQRVA